MLAKAEAKGVYDRLAQADLSLAPEDSGVFGALEQRRADLVSAADVLMYLGNLEGVFVIADRLLAPGGSSRFPSRMHAGPTASCCVRRCATRIRKPLSPPSAKRAACP